MNKEDKSEKKKKLNWKQRVLLGREKHTFIYLTQVFQSPSETKNIQSVSQRLIQIKTVPQNSL